jgi:hypothetical protein
MNGWSGAKRFAALGGVLLAAVASVATSQPSWTVDEKISDRTTLDSSAPEAARHFTASWTERGSASISGRIEWDRSVGDPQAAVRIRLEEDDGEVLETIQRASDAWADRELEDSHFALTINPECSSYPCERGFSVTMTLVDGWPGEHVDLDWTFSAAITGGSDRHDDAVVTLRED